ncbi:MAG: hypothetical protein U0354_17705 [Candidatus Sericytochromatia bacterium]
MSKKPSKELELLRSVLKEENFNPEYAIEFYCLPSKVEENKNFIKKKFNNKCHFFTKENLNQVHVIALVNFSVEKLEQSSKIKDLVQSTDLKLGSFDPKGISFFKR